MLSVCVNVSVYLLNVSHRKVWISSAVSRAPELTEILVCKHIERCCKHVSKLTLALSSKHFCAQAQPQRAVSMAVDCGPALCVISIFILIFREVFKKWAIEKKKPAPLWVTCRKDLTVSCTVRSLGQICVQVCVFALTLWKSWIISAGSLPPKWGTGTVIFS